MSARAKKEKVPEEKPMIPINVRIPPDYHEWLQRRAAMIPGLKISDAVRMILKAEKDREEARGERK